MAFLERINSPEDLREIDIEDLEELAEEIRQKIISVVSKTGGHLASNLGVVELTIAMHRAFDVGQDKIVWDVGHQCYTHKILTGRLDSFHTIRQRGGLSGFPRISESEEYDVYGTGHASTAISAALGMALARDRAGDPHKVMAVVGDGALTGGMAFEALNHAGQIRTDLIVVFNDNEMSISPTVGGLSRRISRLRTAPIYNRFRRDTAELVSKFGARATQLARRFDDSARALLVSGMLFESLDLRHFGPIDGHDIPLLIDTFERVKTIRGPRIVHVVTKKGKGYSFAEDDPTKFHSASPFDISTGKSFKEKKPSYTNAFSNALVRLADKDELIIPITAAMPHGTGIAQLMDRFPDRCFDVGIAEQHAVSLAAGLASQGMKPVVSVYSTFLQRAYDQILHDVCLQNLPVTFALDRAGLVGADGPTHHGVFNYAYLRHIPNMTLMAPKDEAELQHMLKTAIELPGPAALCYPRSAGVGVPLPQELTALPTGKAELLREGTDVLLLAIGAMVYPALEAADMLAENGISAAVVNARFVKPLDKDLILSMSRNIGEVVTIEEHVLSCGFGSAVSEMLVEEDAMSGVHIQHIAIPNEFIEHGTREQLLRMNGLTSDGILQFVLKMLASKKNVEATSKVGRTVSAAR